MVSFNVSVKEIGWEKVIIAPKHLPVSICVGTCSENSFTFDINLLILRQLKEMFTLQKYKKSKKSINLSPCCTATSYKKIGAAIMNIYGEIEHVSLELIANDCVCL